MRVDLNGKVSLVTGAGNGIGKAIALLLATNGADVVVNDINEAGAQATRDEILALGRKSFVAIADVGESKQVGRMVEQAIDTFGHIDILVNNAGINRGRVPIHLFQEDDWSQTLKTDLDGVFLCSKAVAAHMIQAGSGKIVNIGSVAGLIPLRLQSAYVAAKAGVINLTRSMALELGPHNINVNAVAPGSTLTEGTKSLFYSQEAEFQEKAKSLLAHIPMGRPGTPEDIAHAVLFLASEEAGYVTGCTLVVDGGWTAGGYARDF